MQTGNCLCRGDGYFLVPVELHNQHLSHDYLFLFVFVKKKSTCSLGSTVLVEMEPFEPCSASLPLTPPPTHHLLATPTSYQTSHALCNSTFGAKQQKPQDVSGTSAVRPQTIFFYWGKKKKKKPTTSSAPHSICMLLTSPAPFTPPLTADE